jgi:hypothetical protein
MWICVLVYNGVLSPKPSPFPQALFFDRTHLCPLPSLHHCSVHNTHVHILSSIRSFPEQATLFHMPPPQSTLPLKPVPNPQMHTAQARSLPPSARIPATPRPLRSRKAPKTGQSLRALYIESTQQPPTRRSRDCVEHHARRREWAADNYRHLARGSLGEVLEEYCVSSLSCTE